MDNINSHIESAQGFRHLALTFHRKYITLDEFCYNIMKESARKFPVHSCQVQKLFYTLVNVADHIISVERGSLLA